MFQSYLKGRYLFFTLSIALAQFASASPICPSDIIKPFVGQWRGNALLIPTEGNQQPTETKDEFAVVDCQSFEVTINYLDSAGNVGRVLLLKASPDKSGPAGLFTVNGTITEGSAVSKMTGSFKSIQEGTLLGSFSGAIGGKPAYLNELMNLSTLPTGESQLVRTIQMFSVKQGGPYLGTRVVKGRKVSASK
jgi:hypothetical protein